MLLFTSSELGQPILNYNFHQYTKKRPRKTRNEWPCRDRGCASTLSLCTIDSKVRDQMRIRFEDKTYKMIFVSFVFFLFLCYSWINQLVVENRMFIKLTTN